MSEHILENVEISVNYTSVHGTWERSSIIIDDVLAYSVPREIIETDDIEARSVDECQRRADWPKWKDAIQAELDSLAKRKVFGNVVPIPPNTNLLVINGYSLESVMRGTRL